jgi:hypothetical protein
MILSNSRGIPYAAVDLSGEGLTLEVGAIVFCDLLWGAEKHSGVYIGENKIIELNGNGYLTEVDLYQFVYGSKLKPRTGKTLKTFCDINGRVLSDINIAKKAWIYKESFSKLGYRWGYNLFFKNCHKFTTYCMIESDINNTIIFEDLKLVVSRYFGEYLIRTKEYVVSIY